MKELQDIVKAFDNAQREGRQTALATVVHVDGSAYRRAGARMLVTDDGQLTGAISGGCLEGDALRKARLVMVKQQPMLVTYDTTDDDDAKLGVGLGCNGLIHILIEPIIPGIADNPLTFFKHFLSRREPVVLITVFNMADRHATQYGTCLLLDKNGVIAGALPDDTIGDLILADALEVLQNGNSFTKTYVYQDSCTCFIELLQPAVSLVIAGAGNDSIPLTAMAKILGWQTILIDGRANYNTRERFPLAGKLIVAKPGEAIAQLAFDSRTIFMLMTHNYNYDLALLKCLLPMQPAYIGILGPKKRLRRMVDELSAEIEITENQLQSIYGPAGLDVGSENAEEIALAIVAEIQAVLSKRNGASLKYKETIHNRGNKTRSYQSQPDDLNVDGHICNT
ncbi:MAG TPA: XdhC family protein [Mucilaginibacter sp.]